MTKPYLLKKSSSFIARGWAIEITDVYWADDVESGVIGVSVDVWPDWDGWRCYLNGEEVPMEGVEEGRRQLV